MEIDTSLLLDLRDEADVQSSRKQNLFKDISPSDFLGVTPWSSLREIIDRYHARSGKCLNWEETARLEEANGLWDNMSRWNERVELFSKEWGLSERDSIVLNLEHLRYRVESMFSGFASSTGEWEAKSAYMLYSGIYNDGIKGMEEAAPSLRKHADLRKYSQLLKNMTARASNLKGILTRPFSDDELSMDLANIKAESAALQKWSKALQFKLWNEIPSMPENPRILQMEEKERMAQESFKAIKTQIERQYAQTSLTPKLASQAERYEGQMAEFIKVIVLTSNIGMFSNEGQVVQFWGDAREKLGGDNYFSKLAQSHLALEVPEEFTRACWAKNLGDAWQSFSDRFKRDMNRALSPMLGELRNRFASGREEAKGSRIAARPAKADEKGQAVRPQAVVDPS